MFDKNEVVLVHEQNSQISRGANSSDLTDLQKKNLWSSILIELSIRHMIWESMGYDKTTILAKQKEFLAKYGICLKEDEVL